MRSRLGWGEDWYQVVIVVLLLIVDVIIYLNFFANVRYVSTEWVSGSRLV